MQLRHAVNDRRLTFHLNARTHAVELGGVAEAVIVNALGHKACPLGQRHTHGDLRLHVGREARIRHGLHIRAAKTVVGFDADRVVILRNLCTHLAQLRGDAVEVLRNDVIDRHIAAHGSRRSHIGSGLDLVGNDRVIAALQLANAANLNDIGSRAGYLRAHSVQEVRKVNDMRLLRAVFDDRHAAAKNGSKQNVHRRADGNNVKVHMAALEAAIGRICADIAAQLLDARAHRLKALDVLVDGTHAEIAAAGHGDARVAKASELCADEIVGSADAAHKIDGCRSVAHVRAVDLERVPAEAADVRAHIS